jgi:hypothetical protein
MPSTPPAGAASSMTKGVSTWLTPVREERTRNATCTCTTADADTLRQSCALPRHLILHGVLVLLLCVLSACVGVLGRRSSDKPPAQVRGPTIDLPAVPSAVARVSGTLMCCALSSFTVVVLASSVDFSRQTSLQPNSHTSSVCAIQRTPIDNKRQQRRQRELHRHR